MIFMPWTHKWISEYVHAESLSIYKYEKECLCVCACMFTKSVAGSEIRSVYKPEEPIKSLLNPHTIQSALLPHHLSFSFQCFRHSASFCLSLQLLSILYPFFPYFFFSLQWSAFKINKLIGEKVTDFLNVNKMKQILYVNEFPIPCKSQVCLIRAYCCLSSSTGVWTVAGGHSQSSDPSLMLIK